MASPATPLKDDPSRLSAIAEHGLSLLVEAGAGSGKTAIMAGRVAMMLAGGTAPKSIAAVTFTELAASELLSRVREFVSVLLAGKVPTELKTCLPEGLSVAQRRDLLTASETIDDIVCTTIHGFCQRLVKPYPVEADIDPGAKVADRGQADLLFQEVVDAWLRGRLSGGEGGLLAEMVVEDVEATMDAVDAILVGIRKHRILAGPPAQPLPPLLDAYLSAVRRFHGFVETCAVREPKSIEIAGHFRAHADALPGSGYTEAPVLVRLLGSKLSDALFNTKGDFYVFPSRSKWETAAKSGAIPKAQAGLVHSEAADLYVKCCNAWNALAGAIGAATLGRLVEELRPAVDQFQAQKRAIGLLDFDDLIHSAVGLLRNHDAVRRALAMRYQRVLVDEFQDTDPLQAEIFWRLCGEPDAGADPANWRSFTIRPGALFVVGDPKQAIYRFRGADVAAYVDARAAFVAAGALAVISTNFRSRPKVLNFVNERFQAVLGGAGQPGFTELDSFHPDLDGHSGVFALDVDVGGIEAKPNAETRRDAEAEAVAEMCSRMIGRLPIYDHATGQMRPCRAGDIALLAPTSTNLWRYEAALEERGVAVSTQAGKGLFRQQEIQDLIALTRVLADGRDTLALGSLLRGPLVGMTEEQLLDLVWNLPRPESRPESIPPLSLSIEPEQVADPFAGDIFRTLRYLRGLANSTTPHALLSQAVDMFNVRAVMRRRHSRQAERALANVDLYLEMAKAYSVRGLRAFAEAMASSWSEARSEGGKVKEGRVDIQEEAVSLYTMHASKGLEWPVVVPINSMGPPKAIAPEIVDRAAGLIYVSLFGVDPAGYKAAHAAEKAEVERERARLWYVTATRARDLLVLPRPNAPIVRNAWGAIVDLALDTLPALDLPPSDGTVGVGTRPEVNSQTKEEFAREAATIADTHRRLKWLAPSRDEGPASGAQEVAAPITLLSDVQDEEIDDLPIAVQGGRNRGLVIHKLFEEVLNGETDDATAALSARAADLIAELGETASNDPKTGLSPAEIATRVSNTLALPDIAALRSTLTPEMPVYASETIDGVEIATVGVADAASYDASGKPHVIVDWKSDVDPAPDVVNGYREQVRSYMAATGAPLGLVVFVTSGKIERVPRVIL